MKNRSCPIGILCNEKRMKTLYRRLHKLFRPLIKGRDTSIVVFTLKGLDLRQKTVAGRMISCKRPSAITTDLPAIIFNLAVQRSRSEIKTVRGLMEMEDVALINITNRYNQWSIMEMLSSDNSLKKYVLPYAGTDRQNAKLIIKPMRGASQRRIIYGRQSEGHRNRVLLLKAPGLPADNGRLCISRIFAQRNFNGDWEVLSRHSVPQNECDAAIHIISYVNRFIPDVFFCFVDFVADMNGTPYLISFGGWDNRILSRKRRRDIHTKVCKNMLEYAHAFFDRSIEVGDYVD